MPSRWLIKSEPTTYSWSRFLEEGRTRWDGVRSYEARNNLRAMRMGDLALFYHSNEGKAVVGVARVVATAYPDPTSDEDWSAVDFAPVVGLERPVTLAEIKETKALEEMKLLKQSRLSVVPVDPKEFALILKMGKTRLK